MIGGLVIIWDSPHTTPTQTPALHIKEGLRIPVIILGTEDSYH